MSYNLNEISEFPKPLCRSAKKNLDKGDYPQTAWI